MTSYDRHELGAILQLVTPAWLALVVYLAWCVWWR